MAITSTLIKSFQFSALTTALALAGCGGGGGNDTLQPPAKGNVPSNNGSVITNPTSNVNITAIKLIDANGQTVSTINNNGANAVVKVTDASGKEISGALVTFTSTGGVTFGTTNGAVLTNGNGEASISIKPTSLTDTGAYSLTAAASYNGASATTASYNFSLQPANVNITNLAAASNSLASGGSTNITLVTTDANTNTMINNAIVNFSATCGTFTSNAVTSSNQGNVTTTYKAIDANGNLCEGTQTITATSSNGTASKTLPITIAAIQANSIIYTTSKNVSLVTRGSGSSTSDTIEFTVYANGSPAANQSVNISLTQGPNDLSLSSASVFRQTTLTSDANGKVIVRLFPGTLPGPVEVKATLASNTNVYATSKDVAIATGRVYQNGISLSAEKSSLKGWVDGESTTISVSLTDRVGNPVPKGTSVSFISEGGSITPNCSTNELGRCSVTLTVQNPRPINGRASVLAFVEGDKAYIDANGNNMWEVGEKFVNNIGDFFRDDNENNKYDAGEFRYARGESGGECGLSSFVTPNIDGTCGTGLDAILRRQIVISFSSKAPTISGLADPLAIPLDDNQKPLTTFIKSFSIYGNSEMTIPMPSGTKVSFNSTDNTKDNNLSCTVEMRSGDSTVPNNPTSTTPNYTAAFKDCADSDEFKMTITPPGELSQTYTYTLRK